MIEAPRFFSVQCNHYLGTIPLVCIVNQWTVFFRGASLDWKELKFMSIMRCCTEADFCILATHVETTHLLKLSGTCSKIY